MVTAIINSFCHIARTHAHRYTDTTVCRAYYVVKCLRVNIIYSIVGRRLHSHRTASSPAQSELARRRLSHRTVAPDRMHGSYLPQSFDDAGKRIHMGYIKSRCTRSLAHGIRAPLLPSRLPFPLYPIYVRTLCLTSPSPPSLASRVPLMSAAQRTLVREHSAYEWCVESGAGATTSTTTTHDQLAAPPKCLASRSGTAPFRNITHLISRIAPPAVQPHCLGR